MEAYMFHILKMNVIAAVMIMLAMIFARFAKGKYSSKWKYYMWLAIMIFLLLPFNFSSKSPVKLQISRTETGQQASEIVNTAVSGKTGNNGSSETHAEPEAVLSVKQENSVIELSSPKISLYGLLKAMAVIWISGIIFFGAVRGMKYYFSLHSMMRWSYPTDNDKLLELYFYICRKKHIKNPPRLLVCEGLSSPMLAGLRNPGLYVPVESYGMEELEFIFSHELSHYIRKDLWYKMLMIVVTTIYWFNPALYWMQREAEKDIENLCDGKMAVNYSMQECRRYGELLLKIAATQNHVPYLSVSLSDSKQVFKDRILYMRNLKSLKEKLFPAILLTVVMAVSHVLVGISIGDIPVMAGNLVDFQPEARGLTDMSTVAGQESDGGEFGTPEGKASGQAVSMVPSIRENKENQENTHALPDSEADSRTEQVTEVRNEEADTQQEGAENPSSADDTADTSQMEEPQNPTLTDERVTVYGNGGNSATYVYRATDGNWYDGGWQQYYGNGGGEWVEAGTGSVWTEQGPPNPSDSAQAEASVTDESGLNSQSLYLGADGVWQNGARGVYTDNGDGTYTGPDGAIWYQN